MLINRNSQDCSRSCILACEVLLSHPMTLRISSCQSSRPWACRGPRNLAIVSKRGCWSRWYQASAYAFAAMEVDNPLVPAYCTACWPQCIHLCREALVSTCGLLCKARGGHSRTKTCKLTCKLWQKVMLGSKPTGVLVGIQSTAAHAATEIALTWNILRHGD